MPPRLCSVPWHSFPYLSDNTRAREPVSRAVRVFWRRPAPRLLVRLIASPLALFSFRSAARPSPRPCSRRAAAPQAAPPGLPRALSARALSLPHLGGAGVFPSRAVAHLGRGTPLPGRAPAVRLCGSRPRPLFLTQRGLPEAVPPPAASVPCLPWRAQPAWRGPGARCRRDPPQHAASLDVSRGSSAEGLCDLSFRLLETPPPVRMTVETCGHVMPLDLSAEEHLGAQPGCPPACTKAPVPI